MVFNNSILHIIMTWDDVTSCRTLPGYKYMFTFVYLSWNNVKTPEIVLIFGELV